jgi:hypothetical protein
MVFGTIGWGFESLRAYLVCEQLELSASSWSGEAHPLPPSLACGGACSRQVLLERSEEAGIRIRTLERAKAALRVISEQRREQGRNVGYWQKG